MIQFGLDRVVSSVSMPEIAEPEPDPFGLDRVVSSVSIVQYALSTALTFGLDRVVSSVSIDTPSSLTRRRVRA